LVIRLPLQTPYQSN